MSSESYSDAGGDFADEEFLDEVEPAADDETVDALQNFIGEQVSRTLGEHRAVEELMADNPSLDVEELAQVVKAKAAAIGAPELEHNVAYWIQVAEAEGAARSANEPQTAEEFYDKEVIGRHSGASVLDFDSKP